MCETIQRNKKKISHNGGLRVFQFITCTPMLKLKRKYPTIPLLKAIQLSVFRHVHGLLSYRIVPIYSALSHTSTSHTFLYCSTSPITLLVTFTQPTATKGNLSGMNDEILYHGPISLSTWECSRF